MNSAGIVTTRQLQITGEQYRFTRSPGADLQMLSYWRRDCRTGAQVAEGRVPPEATTHQDSTEEETK